MTHHSERVVGRASALDSHDNVHMASVNIPWALPFTGSKSGLGMVICKKYYSADLPMVGGEFKSQSKLIVI